MIARLALMSGFRAAAEAVLGPLRISCPVSVAIRTPREGRAQVISEEFGENSRNLAALRTTLA